MSFVPRSDKTLVGATTAWVASRIGAPFWTQRYGLCWNKKCANIQIHSWMLCKIHSQHLVHSWANLWLRARVCLKTRLRPAMVLRFNDGGFQNIALASNVFKSIQSYLPPTTPPTPTIIQFICGNPAFGPYKCDQNDRISYFFKQSVLPWKKSFARVFERNQRT